MQRSKLESCEEILGALVKKPATADNLSFEIDMECSTLRHHLDFLLKNGLVDERISGKKIQYVVTERGIAVLKILNFQKYIEKVANTIRVVDDALQALSTITKHDNRKEETY